MLNVQFADTKLVLTDPIYNVPAIKDLSDEILFEQYGYHSLTKTSGNDLDKLDSLKII